MDTFIHKKVAVLGFGVEGESVVQFLLEQDADIAVFYEKENDVTSSAQIQNWKDKGVTFFCGPFPDLTAYNCIIHSPGIRPDLPALVAAKNNGVEITSATQIFFSLCPCPIIGVTGTKGKGTTSTLITTMLKAAGRDVYLGGNIGVPPLSFLSALTKDSIVVLELSSFQLYDCSISPHIAVVLMTTSEHLDWHTSTEEYVQAKANILRFQGKHDIAVINSDYVNSKKIAEHIRGKHYAFSMKEPVQSGCFIRDAQLVFVDAGKEEIIISLKDIFIPGAHNWENAAAATIAAIAAGVPIPIIQETLHTFRGLMHRLEYVREIEGVKYYDDSFSTVPETAIAAILAFAAPKVLILGGSSKKSDFTQLGKLVAESSSIRAIIGIGMEWQTIKACILPSPKNIQIIEHCKTMPDIVAAAQKIALTGDVVVLTPACASFDMFKNYKDRGDQFKHEVLAL